MIPDNILLRWDEFNYTVQRPINIDDEAQMKINLFRKDKKKAHVIIPLYTSEDIIKTKDTKFSLRDVIPITALKKWDKTSYRILGPFSLDDEAELKLTLINAKRKPINVLFKLTNKRTLKITHE